MTQERKTYRIVWRNRYLTCQCESIAEMAEDLRAAAAKLEAMARDGIVLESTDGMDDDYADLVTTDREVAEAFNLMPDHWHCECCGTEQPGDHLDGCSLADLDE
ncbi:MAG: hypothetical protein KJO40_13660 [Deltaproteobacteria bacterium]|nr:hypothetical protein [Deltaproteobacteria bacterium]